MEHVGMIKTGTNIVKNEGLLKLWSGLTPMLQRHAVYAGFRLLIYEKTRDYLRDKDGNISLQAASFGGCFVLAREGSHLKNVSCDNFQLTRELPPWTALSGGCER
ncbi:Mitochondrial uncoupling protein 4 [Eumeta japonica]|uniref:Mitochondrial uncoupling protein 4 n=1 Tax=Eumeta variegata TaxID=151549 RepID=A0A4C1UVB1_EUMVA|nr:Mitochondrial uncoupling protein 4 [Eumeta japonica]